MIRVAHVARTHPERSVRIFLPFEPLDGFDQTFYHPEPMHFGSATGGYDINYSAYIPLMKIPTKPYRGYDHLRALLRQDAPDFVLINQPLNVYDPERTGFLHHGVVWEGGVKPIVHHTVTQWDGWCKLHLVAEPKIAEALISAGIPKERVKVCGLVHNDYLLTLNREKMRRELCATLGVSKDTFLVLFCGNVWKQVSTIQDHYTILDWLTEYANSADNVRIIVKPKTLHFRSRGNAERVTWLDSAPMVFDSFGADAMVSMPVGTSLADACVADMPVVLAAPGAVHDEVEAIAHGIGPLAQSRDELVAALDGIRRNPQAFAAGRMAYLDRMYPDGFGVPAWRRVLSCVEEYLA